MNFSPSLVAPPYPNWHGSPYDRGCADAWHKRPFSPHKFLDPVTRERLDLSDPAEREAYKAGFDSMKGNS